jgi:hypothetical protein
MLKITTDIVGASLVADLQQPMGAPTHVSVVARWRASANFITRRDRGAQLC